VAKGRFYTASFSAVTVSALQDVFEVNAPADAVVIIHKIVLGQSSDYGDSAAEGLEVILSKATGTAGSGGSTITARPHQLGSAAFGGTVERNNTTQAGTTIEIHADTFNIQAGWYYSPDPEKDEEIVLSPSEVFVVELPVAPTDAITMSGSITLEEIGG